MNKRTDLNKDFLTVKELADILGISRVAVFNKVKKGQILAKKIGKTYLISKDQLSGVIDDNLSESIKTDIKKGVAKAIHDYGETLRMLGKE